jgi:hypothetical protein
MFISCNRYVPTDPAKFRVGDIVEAQLSFVLFPMLERRWKFGLVLRSLALIDSTYSHVSAAFVTSDRRY